MNEWLTDEWACIHSRASDHAGMGLLALVKRKFCQANNISWLSVMDGHLVHLRLQGYERPIDVLACYQFMDDRSPTRLRQRQGFWQKLDSYLRLLPKRDQLILLGDLNCGITALTGQVGLDTFAWQGRRHHSRHHPDTGDLMNILMDHGLVALNTWDSQTGPTFVHGDHASRFDFIFTRFSHVDSGAKQIKILDSASFMQSPNYGHRPLVGHLPRTRLMNRRVFATGFSLKHRQRLRQEWIRDSASWKLFLQDSRTCLDDFFQHTDLTDSTLVTNLHDSLTPKVKCYLSGQKPHASDPSSHISPVYKSIIESKWTHMAHLQRIARSSPLGLAQWFGCWFHVARATALHRQHKKQATQIRKQKFHDLIQEANHAAVAHDSYKLHSLIRRVAPKVSRQRIHLRNAQGALAHPLEELAILRSFVHDKWNTPQPKMLPLTSITSMPFSESDLETALSRVPVLKAVAMPFLPGIIVRQHASSIAKHLFPLLCTWWIGRRPYVPPKWRDGWLFFLAKPQKTPDRPQNLRPLALQEPIGKAIVCLLARLILQQAFDALSIWPQYAYLPMRSSQDAISRVSAHCRKIRALIFSQRRHALNRMNSVVTRQVCGGLQMFIDLSRAFDSVDRFRLFSALGTCGISADLVSLITAFHSNTHYHLNHHGTFYPIKVNTGVRQGCPAAPILWACFMTQFLRTAASRISPEWISQCVTLYADDFHVGVEFLTEAALFEAPTNIGILLDLLQEFGLTVNVDKSHMIFAIAGTNARKTSDAVLHHTPAGVKICVPRRAGHDQFQVHTHATYLGVRTSYRNMEVLTLQCRMTQMNANFRRLQKWLTNRAMTVKLRLRLWHCCILPTLTYGLFTVGLTSTGLQKIQTRMYQMLRQVIGDHSYITRRTHQQVLHFHNCATPLRLLLQVLQAQLRSIAQRCSWVSSQDIVRRSQWETLESTERLLLSEIHRGTEVSVSHQFPEVPCAAQVLCCHICQFTTDNMANLNRHYTNIHSHMKIRANPVSFRLDAMNGIPQCSHCQHIFTTWSSFRRRVESRVCQVPTATNFAQAQMSACSNDRFHSACAGLSLDVTRQQSPPLMNSAADDALRVKLLPSDLAHLNSSPEGAFVLEAVQSLNWTQLAEADASCKLLRTTCAICGIYVGQVRELLAHLKLYHADLMNHVMAKSAQLTLVHARNSPCCFCAKVFKTNHICPVLIQASLLLVNGADID